MNGKATNINSQPQTPATELTAPHSDSDSVLGAIADSLWWIFDDGERYVDELVSGPIHCPSCSATDLIPVIYGFPNHRMMSMAIQNLCELGGMVPQQDSPAWYCRACGTGGGLLLNMCDSSRSDYLNSIAVARMNCKLLTNEAIEDSFMMESQHIERLKSVLKDCIAKRSELSSFVSGETLLPGWFNGVLRQIPEASQ